MVLNNRLDIFVEENQYLKMFKLVSQKNARTSDKMFVLKSFINKYTKMEGANYTHALYTFKKHLLPLYIRLYGSV